MAELGPKFACAVEAADPPPRDAALDALDALRTELFDLGLLGVLGDGVGYGNVSIRDAAAGGLFTITATGTGGRRRLEAGGYVVVTAVDPAANRLACRGRARASAESFSHAAVYAAAPGVGCVVHVHSTLLWRLGLEAGWPATPPGVEYGTPAMAEAIGACVRAAGAARGRIVMAGHRDGVLVYGADVGEARGVLIATLAECLRPAESKSEA